VDAARIETCRGDLTEVVVAVYGEIDVSARARLVSSLRAAVGMPGVNRVVVDLTGTSFMDASGIGALVVGREADEVVHALETVNAERGTTIVVVTHDAEVGARLGRAVTIRDGRVGAEGRDGQDFAVVAGDGTVQLPPEVLGDFPPGTLFTVDRVDGSVSLFPAATAASTEPVVRQASPKE
jgi:anti-anti-sigma factor